jgi:hypothetical protein
MFILTIILPLTAAAFGATAFTLALRGSSLRKKDIPTTPDGVGIDQWNNNCTFGTPRYSSKEEGLFGLKA